MKNPTYQYKIVKKGKDQGDHRIEKHGLTAEFSLREMHSQIKDAETQVMQIQGGVKGIKVIVDNIKTHHPDIVKLIASLTPKKKHVLLEYATRYRKLQEYEAALKEAKAILKRLQDENKLVRKVLKLK